MTEATFKAFSEKWIHPDHMPIPIRAGELDRVEARFETHLPRSYRRFMELVGPANTGAALLDSIIEQNLNIPCLQEFFPPKEMIEATTAWREMGLSDAMVAFASEGSGDLYCFQVVPETEAAPDDALVWYFDHEDRETECLDLVFSTWLSLYARTKRVEA